MTYDLLKFAHVIGACVLLGTGAGIAFFMLVSHLSKNPVLIAHVAGIVVLADTVFTATAALLQPVTGYFLALEVGWPLLKGWVFVSLCLYVFVGALWLPVVWIQIRMRRLAAEAAEAGTALPVAYFRLFHIWFACGVPAFAAVLAIVWLMLTKPDFSG
ncbi:DUF2269 family protein [Roseibium aggregatum]|uniref:DUF2269 domain-containing protein n=1 Tax=Roseibium aggregatum TaxID=187304 RepID=A0A939EGP2_9HYPH|nr:DUF2269 domain-containing protein [Roseibium aggregatum]MBN9672634.1 DUF2269 domain-containing protein [Roseibium aggregatum]